MDGDVGVGVMRLPVQQGIRSQIEQLRGLFAELQS